MPESALDYKQILTRAIQKQIVILGRQITLAKARKIEGLTVEDDGTVSALSGDPKQIVTQLIQSFQELSSPLVQKTMQPLLDIVMQAPVAQEQEEPNLEKSFAALEPKEPADHASQSDASLEAKPENPQPETPEPQTNPERKEAAQPATTP